jgi:hypothetical protein
MEGLFSTSEVARSTPFDNSLNGFTSTNVQDAIEEVLAGASVYTDEMAQDTIATLIQNGTGISWAYNDGLNTLTPTISLSSFSTTDLAEGTNLYYTDARARGAISVTDSSSIDFTYAVGNITGVVLPGGVDHDLLLNWVSNKHIDHSLVSLIAGTGISVTGLGDITASRTINLANTAVTPGSYGTASAVSTYTVDAQGRLTASVNTPILITTSQISDFVTAVNLNVSTSRFSDFDQEDFHQHHIYHFLDVGANGGTITLDNGVPVDNSYMGRVILSTGTTNNSTGRATLDGNSSVNNVKVANLSLEWRVRLPTLSTGVIGYQFRTGLLDLNTAGDPANGIYFYYSEDVNGGSWRGVTRNASTSTNVDSAIPVVANTWYKLKFISKNNGANVDFYVNEVLMGSSATNIPTTNATRAMAKLEKKAPSSATARTCDIDYLAFGVSR